MDFGLEHRNVDLGASPDGHGSWQYNGFWAEQLLGSIYQGVDDHLIHFVATEHQSPKWSLVDIGTSSAFLGGLS